MAEPVVNPHPTAANRADAAANFGFALAVLNSNPELKKAFGSAVKYGWTPQRFIAEIRDTDWFSKHAETWRKAETLRLTDPATYKDDLAKSRADIRDTAGQMGAVLTDKQLDAFALSSYRFGWTRSQQQDTLATYVHAASGGPLKGQYIGDAGKNAADLQSIALRNGYKIPKGSLGKWNRDIMAGNATVADYEQRIRRQAAAAFPTFADELHAGADLEDLASPYKASMARILEIPESEVTLFDPKIRKALASKDPKSGKPTATPIYDFEDQLRADPRWMKTDNAHAEVMGLGRQVLNQMGF
jgi:hypothetical protein